MLLATTGTDATSYITGTLARGTWYFKASAFNSIGDSDDSSTERAAVAGSSREAAAAGCLRGGGGELARVRRPTLARCMLFAVEEIERIVAEVGRDYCC
jgi:hypothetical protein